MKKITAIFLILVLLFSFAACTPDSTQVEPDDAPIESDEGVPPSKPPVADPAEGCTVTESDSTGVYDETGIYFFAPEEIEDAAYRLIGMDELDETIAEMSFTVQDNNEKDVKIAYRVQKSEMIDADEAEVLFGTKELANRDTLRISNNVTNLRYEEGGEAILYWHSSDTGRNCCAYFSSCEDRDTVILYGNLLYAFVHSDMKPE